MPNEVTIVVRSIDQTDAGFTSAVAKSKVTGDKIGQNLEDGIKKHDPAITTNAEHTGTTAGMSMADALQGALESNRHGIEQELAGIGDSSGLSFADHVGSEIEKELPSRVRKSSSKVRSEAEKVGEQAGSSLASGLSTDFAEAIPPLMSPIGLAVAGALVVAMAPVITAGVTAAVGGGVLGLGVMLQKGNPGIQTGFKILKDDATRVFSDASEPLVQPIIDALGSVDNFIKGHASEFRDLFAAAAPAIQPLMKSLLSIADSILPSLVSLSQSFAEIMSDPGVQQDIARLGKSFAELFQAIADHKEDAKLVFEIIIDSAGAAAKSIQTLIGLPDHIKNAFVSMGRGIVREFKTIEASVLGTIGDIAHYAALIPGPWQSTFKTVEKGAKDMADKINKDLAGIQDQTVNINYVVHKVDVGTPQTHHDSYAHGGVVGAAASGGIRSNMVWVGERGPELVDLAPGSMVYPSGQSQQMASQGGSGLAQNIEVVLTFAGNVDSALASSIAKMSRNNQLQISAKAIVPS